MEHSTSNTRLEVILLAFKLGYLVNGICSRQELYFEGSSVWIFGDIAIIYCSFVG